MTQTDSQAQRRVLVVDDDDAIRDVLSQILVLEDFAVRLAANGAEALTLLDADRRCGLILLDLMMPVMDGWEFRRRQLADPALAAIPVVLFSGGDRVAEYGQELKATTSIEKPIDVDHLLITIDRHCLVCETVG